MRGSLVAASLLSALSVSAAQHPEPIPPGTAAISGRVIDRDTERPLPGVIMTLTTVTLPTAPGAGVLKALTDGDGRYLFEGIAAGTYRVSTFLEGYATQEPLTGSIRQLEGSSVVFVRDREARRGIDYSLVRGASIAGRITSAEDKPLEDAIVRATLLEQDGFSFSADPQARTSERGEYLIRNLPAGRHRISVVWHDPEMLKAKADVETHLTYFPGTREIHEAIALTLGAGTELRGIDVRLPPSDRVRFDGHILRSASEGEIEANMMLPAFAIRTVIIADTDGAFEVTHLKPGRHTFWARAATADGFEAAWLDVELESDLTGVVLPMMPTAEIRGRVVMNDGTALPKGLQVAANLVDQHGAQIDALPRDRTDVHDDGTFYLRGVFGHRTLTVVGLTHEHMLDEILLGRTRIKMLTLASGESVEQVTLLVRKRE